MVMNACLSLWWDRVEPLMSRFFPFDVPSAIFYLGGRGGAGWGSRSIRSCRECGSGCMEAHGGLASLQSIQVLRLPFCVRVSKSLYTSPVINHPSTWLSQLLEMQLTSSGAQVGGNQKPSAREVCRKSAVGCDTAWQAMPGIVNRDTLCMCRLVVATYRKALAIRISISCIYTSHLIKISTALRPRLPDNTYNHSWCH